MIGSGFLQTRRQKKGYRKDLTVHFHWPTLQVECLLAVPRRDSVLFFSSFVYRLFLFFKKVGQNKKKRKRNGRDVLRPSEVYNKWTQLFITLSPRSTLYSRCCCCLRARDASHAIYQITIGKKKKRRERGNTTTTDLNTYCIDVYTSKGKKGFSTLIGCCLHFGLLCCPFLVSRSRAASCPFMSDDGWPVLKFLLLIEGPARSPSSLSRMFI